MKETILLIEDNKNIQDINRRTLVLEGYQVLTASSLIEADVLWQQHKVDLIVLDIMLPDGSGLDFCRKLRLGSSVPILFLTALGEKEQMLAGLRAGGDDYLTKPYDLEVLLVRVQTLLRRVTLDKSDQRREYGPFTLDPAAAQVFLNGTDMLLTKKEFLLLSLLMQNEGKIMSKEIVYQKVWGQPLADDSKALYMLVSRLKKKLEPAAGEGIRLTAERDEGYRLTFREIS